MENTDEPIPVLPILLVKEIRGTETELAVSRDGIDGVVELTANCQELTLFPEEALALLPILDEWRPWFEERLKNGYTRAAFEDKTTVALNEDEENTEGALPLT